MPFRPVSVLDPVKCAAAEKALEATFRIPSIHEFQRDIGHSILLGHTTILDAPTGAGKTLAFLYALFYFWHPGNAQENEQKNVIVVSPLVELMQSQVSPAIHIHCRCDADLPTGR